MQELTQNEVKDILDKTSSILNNVSNFDMKEFSDGFKSAMGVYTPDTQNALMKNINLNPLVGNAEKILSDLQNAKNNEFNIIGYSQSEYLTNMIYKRNFDYIKNLPSFDLSIQCKNAKPEDYKSKVYKKDLEIVKEFLDKFDYRNEFRNSFFNMLNTESYFCMLRTDMNKDKYVLQDFPYQYAKITAKFSHGLIADYDLTYFINSSVDISLFPKFIRKKFNELFKGKDTKKYIPSNSIGNRDGTFALWVQTSPDDGCFIFKMTPQLIANIPYFSPMLAETTLTPIYRKLQLNQSMAAAKKILTNQWPLIKDQKAGNVADSLAVSGDTMGKILGTVVKAIGDAINIVSIPSDKIESHEFKDTNPDGYENFLRTTASLIGGGNVLFNSQKQNATETLMSINIDELLAESIYPQFENFLDFYVNKLTKKFKFRFKFSGSNLDISKDKKIDRTFTVADKGVVCINKIANALDMNIFELDDELNMTQSMNIQDKLMPLLNIYSMSGKSEEGGRPKKNISDLSESGINTRDSSSNVEKGGNI